MGHSRSNSVLDENGEARWVDRLYIAAQRLATRTAENIFVKYFDGDRWVKTESPLTSIDRKVTNAVIERGL